MSKPIKSIKDEFKKHFQFPSGSPSFEDAEEYLIDWFISKLEKIVERLEKIKEDDREDYNRAIRYAQAIIKEYISKE